MSTSPYPELKALSKHDRGYQIYQHLKHIEYTSRLMTEITPFAPSIRNMHNIQQHLDRIKQLVLTRGTNEK